MFVHGLEGLEYPEDLKTCHEMHPVAGFILFARNYKDSEQLSKLCGEIPASYPPCDGAYIISADQKGCNCDVFYKFLSTF